jgi:prevent-host-death family protein
MPKTVPVREFRTNLSELLSDVADRRDHVLVTRNGKPAAALVPIDEYGSRLAVARDQHMVATIGDIAQQFAELGSEFAYRDCLRHKQKCTVLRTRQIASFAI